MAVELKLLIDKDKGRVACAESDKVFVDTIFSYLTTTVGTIVRLSSKKSSLGCMDTLYESIENLDSQYLQTPAVKEMLLRPRSAFEHGFDGSKDLALSIDPGLSKCYVCSRRGCAWSYYSSVKNTQCLCGSPISREEDFRKATQKAGEEGVFLKGNMRFVIADGLSVGLFSTTAYLSRLSKLGVSNWTNLDVKSVNVSTEEAFHLLKRSLVSKTPLTDVFLTKVGATDEDAVNINPTSEDAATEVKGSSKKMRVKLMLSKSKNKLLYAEANADFVDLLFSFLTFPLGSIVKLLGPGSSIHCLDNLYKSVEDLSTDDSCIISEKCRATLLDPKLAFHWLSENQLLPVMEERPCRDFVNPKVKVFSDARGGGFVNGPKTAFMVTDGLDVKPMTLVLGISILESFSISFSDLQEAVVSVGEKEALSLLRASLCSKTVLTDVFCRQKLQQSEIKLECNYYNPYRP